MNRRSEAEYLLQVQNNMSFHSKHCDFSLSENGDTFFLLERSQLAATPRSQTATAKWNSAPVFLHTASLHLHVLLDQEEEEENHSCYRDPNTHLLLSLLWIQR